MIAPSIDIGELPSTRMDYSFDRVLVRELMISDISLLELVQGMKKIYLIVNLIQNLTNLTNQQVWSLTEGDAAYILSYVKRLSFTDIPIPLAWTCKNPVITRKGFRLDFLTEKGLSDREIEARGYEHRTCGLKNAELIYPYSMRTEIVSPTIGEIDLNSSLLRMPRLRDLYLIQDMRDEKDWPRYARLEELLLWLPGQTASDKKALLAELVDVREKAQNYIRQSYAIRCAECDYRGSVPKRVDMFNALHLINSITVMNKQYNIMKVFGVLPAEETPLRKLLFWVSAYKKDKIDEYGAEKKVRKRGR
jgi:hypothetical protein